MNNNIQLQNDLPDDLKLGNIIAVDGEDGFKCKKTFV